MPLLERLQRDPDFVDLHTLSVLSIDLKYASLDNFMGKNVYGDFNRAFLHRHAAEKLLKAAAVLRLIRPDWRLLVLDALRPRSIQRVLWKHVQRARAKSNTSPIPIGVRSIITDLRWT
jgi:D-alanyl-D-alanine dipeptidase